ncbi:MAG: glutamate-5-semialdehyde dehydrogenase, partial [Ilumatobacteraceae bacterium]
MVSENRSQILEASDRILIGNELLSVGDELAAAFSDGDRLLGIAETKEILHIRREELLAVSECVSRSKVAFEELRAASEESIISFFTEFARLLSDRFVIEQINSANAKDLADAKLRGRATTRLELTEQMRLGMIDSLEIWKNQVGAREVVLERVEHEGWSVESVSAPLGIIGFVFEGRPNVFVDAAGVLRSGNTCVLRIGGDALRTARAIMEFAIGPALTHSGLPPDAIQLINSKSHAAGWALFSDARVALAIARGSGQAVDQLGAIARQAGIPVSLH